MVSGTLAAKNMTKDRVRKAFKLRNKGLTYKQIAYEMYVHEMTIRRWLRNYETYGDTLFTDYPTVVVQSSDDQT